MKPFTTGDVTALVRVDFADDSAWERVRDAVLASGVGDVPPNIEVVEDRDYLGVDFDAMESAPEGYDASVLVVFDEQARVHPEHPLLLVDWRAHLDDEDEFSPASLRVTADQVDVIAINLSIANMGFDDFARGAGADGIFRGFRS